MRKNGGGCIINLGSICSLIGHKFTDEAYTTVKGALSQLTKSVVVRYAETTSERISFVPARWKPSWFRK